jgi:hypothetical protein
MRACPWCGHDVSFHDGMGCARAECECPETREAVLAVPA